MSSSQSNNIDIQYHTGVFNSRANAGLLIPAAVALTAVAVGILGLLHAHSNINIGPLNTLSIGWSFGIAGAGGIVLLSDSIALFCLTQKHRSMKKDLFDDSNQFVTGFLFEASIFYLGHIKKYTEIKSDCVNYFLLQNDKNKGTFHIFPNQLKYNEYVADLKQNGYKYE